MKPVVTLAKMEEQRAFILRRLRAGDEWLWPIFERLDGELNRRKVLLAG